MRNKIWYVLTLALVCATLLAFNHFSHLGVSHAQGDEREDKATKFRPAQKGKEVPDMWRIEFKDSVDAKEIKQLAGDFIGDHSKVVRAFERRKTRRAAWVQCDDIRARIISEDPRVDNVTQSTQPDKDDVVPQMLMSESNPPTAPAASARRAATGTSGAASAAMSGGYRYNVGYNLDRLNLRNRIYDGTFEYNNLSAGVDLYFLDTGIDVSHPEFLNSTGVISRAFVYRNYEPSTNDAWPGATTELSWRFRRIVW